MSPLILLAQAFFNHQTQLQTQNLKEAGMRAAETGRRMAIAGVFFAVAGAFVFAAVLIAVIDLGLQIDKAHTVSFSGLMVSSLVLIAIGVFAGFCGWLSGRETKALAVVAPPPPTETFKGELRPLLEAVAVSFLREFLENQNRKHGQQKADLNDEGSHA